MAMDDDGWVVVSGASGALGRSLARYYSDRGRRVLALDRTETDASQPGIVRRATDLLDEADVTHALADAIPLGDSIDMLVNAVGLIWNEPLLQIRAGKFIPHGLQSWQTVLDANLSAPFVVASRVAARMVRSGGGSIVNFSSIAAQGNAGQAAYSAAKAGIEGLTRTMAIELGPFGVRVNALALGFINVSSTQAHVADTVLSGYVQKTPVGRLGEVEDVIDAVEYLASAAFATGTILPLNGGLRL